MAAARGESPSRRRRGGGGERGQHGAPLQHGRRQEGGREGARERERGVGTWPERPPPPCLLAELRGQPICLVDLLRMGRLAWGIAAAIHAMMESCVLRAWKNNNWMITVIDYGR